MTVDEITEETSYVTETGTIYLECRCGDGMVIYRDEEGVLTHNALKNLLPSLIRKIE